MAKPLNPSKNTQTGGLPPATPPPVFIQALDRHAHMLTPELLDCADLPPGPEINLHQPVLHQLRKLLSSDLAGVKPSWTTPQALHKELLRTTDQTSRAEWLQILASLSHLLQIL